jgi:hypothetical protein
MPALVTLSLIFRLIRGEIISLSDIIGLPFIFILYGGFGFLLIKRWVPKGFDIFEEEF